MNAQTLKTPSAVGRLLKWLLVLILCAAALAYFFLPLQWTEEVEVVGGELIHVKGKQSFRTFGEIAGPSSMFIKDARLTIVDRNGRQPMWHQQLNPLLLLRDPVTREYILVATTDSSEIWIKKMGSVTDVPPYFQFRLGADGWREEPLSDFIFGKRTNLLLNPYWLDFKHKYLFSVVSVADKQAWLNKNGVHRSLYDVKREYRWSRD